MRYTSFSYTFQSLLQCALSFTFLLLGSSCVTASTWKFRCAEFESEWEYCVDAVPANRSCNQALAECQRNGGELVAVMWSELNKQLNDIHELVRKYEVNISAGVFMGKINRSCLIASVSGNSNSIGGIECNRVFQSVPLICQRRVLLIWRTTTFNPSSTLATLFSIGQASLSSTIDFVFYYIGVITTICALFMLPIVVVLLCFLCLKRAHKSVTAPERETNYERENTFELYASIPPLAASLYESPTCEFPTYESLTHESPRYESPTYDDAVGRAVATIGAGGAMPPPPIGLAPQPNIYIWEIKI